ncbi:hypothetical protein Tco_1483823 [Tanacetum coccineum]
MSWFSRCSWCGGPFNGGNFRRCTNVSFGNEFVSNPDPILNDETSVFSYPPSQPQTSSLDQWHCFYCKDPLEEGEHCKRCTCKWCGSGLSKGFCFICASSNGNSSIYDPNPNSFNDSQNFSYPPPQPQTYSYEQTANLRTSTPDFLQRNKLIYKGSTIPLNNMPQISPSVAITPDLPTEELEDSLIMGDEYLSTIHEKESNELIMKTKGSFVEDLVLIPSESEDTSGNDSECILPLCDIFCPINIYEEKSLTFSNPLFDSNDDFTSSDDESLSNEDIPEDNVKIYSNPLFEFDDEYISSDINPIFNEVLKNIESKDSYVSNHVELALLVTPLFDVNKDECFDPGDDEIEACLTSDSIPPGIDGANFDPEGDILLLEKLLYDDPSSLLPPKELYYEDLKVIQSSIDTSTYFEDDYYDSEGDIIYLESLLNNDTIPYLPPEVFLDHDPNNLKDEPDLKSIVKVFHPEIHEKKFSPTYVSLPFEDCHYLSLPYVI